MLAHWSVLIASGLLEAVWALALARSNGFHRVGPTVLFTLALLASMAGLAFAMTALPTGTAYAVWVGIGAVVTVAVSMLRGEEQVSIPRLALLLLLIGSVVGLKVLS